MVAREFLTIRFATIYPFAPTRWDHVRKLILQNREWKSRGGGDSSWNFLLEKNENNVWTLLRPRCSKAIRRSLTSIVFDINPWHEADNIVTATLFSLIGLPSYLYRYKLLFDTLCRKKKERKKERKKEKESKKNRAIDLKYFMREYKMCVYLYIYGCRKIYKNYEERLIESICKQYQWTRFKTFHFAYSCDARQ